METLSDHGREPFVGNLMDLAQSNPNYRTAIWTGEEMQVTLMNIPTGGGEIGLEIHPTHDQMLTLASGTGLVQMGPSADQIDREQTVAAGDTVIVPKNVWHNITNTGAVPMQVMSVYAPVQHPFGTVEASKPE